MQGATAFSILEAAYNLSESKTATLQTIARVATQFARIGPVAVCTYQIPDSLPDREASRFERAEERWILAFNALSRAMPFAWRRAVLSLTPDVFATAAHQPLLNQGRMRTFDNDLKRLIDELRIVVIMGNTGDGDSLSIGFGAPEDSDWPIARRLQLRPIAQHLAAAWRLRTGLTRAYPPQVVAELRADGTPVNLVPCTSSQTARDSLRRAVLTRERFRTRRRTAHKHELWPALVAGRWSLIDAFTASGIRYIVAYENPAEPKPLRALSPREQLVLNHVLAGRSGKWISLELGLSEPTVARDIRTALRRLGTTETTALAGIRTMRFELLDLVRSAGSLAIGRPASTTQPLAALSSTEHDVLTAMLSGKRIAAIAHERGRSRNTVAHQVASIYRKLNVSSRRELLARLAEQSHK